jgi:hypothetical protein
VARLRAVTAVHPCQADSTGPLYRSHPQEILCQPLVRLRQVAVANPAGYLVSEITRGGYGQPGSAQFESLSANSQQALEAQLGNRR